MSVDDDFDRTGGPAFPVNDRGSPMNDGLTIREYFASHAMAALLEGYSPPDSAQSMVPRLVATGAYAVADAMIEARKL